MSRPLIVVRPEPGNAATVAKARAMGLDAHAMPLFAVEPVTWKAQAAGSYGGVLLTSANAVRHSGPGLAEYLVLPAYAVGAATADAARAVGFASVSFGDSDVADLIADIAGQESPALLHLSGEDVTPFDAAGLLIERHIVYRAAEATPPPQFTATLDEAPVILVHSRRAAARVAALIAPALRSRVALVAISAAAASSAGEGWHKLAVAPEPRDEAMLKIAVELCRDDGIKR